MMPWNAVYCPEILRILGKSDQTITGYTNTAGDFKDTWPLLGLSQYTTHLHTLSGSILHGDSQDMLRFLGLIPIIHITWHLVSEYPGALGHSWDYPPTTHTPRYPVPKYPGILKTLCYY